MGELIAHLLGDYVLQNHVMATRKTSSSFWAAVHVALYLLPFLFLTRNPVALAIIGGTHFLIDRFRIARYWVEFWGVGCVGKAMVTFAKVTSALADVFSGRTPMEPAPPFLAVWLLILVDNTFHMLINHFALML